MQNIVLDVSSLAYRSFFSMGQLSYHGTATGVLYGFFRDLRKLIELYPAARMVFCFDSRRSLRKDMRATYKASRSGDLMDADEAEARRQLHKQLDDLREQYLRVLGYKNVFQQDGYEADDLVASVCHCMDRSDRAVILTSDNDMWQLLSSRRVVIQSPKDLAYLTEEMFVKKWGLRPCQWAEVKAMAGCSTDNVQGVPRVGDLTAVKFLLGMLGKGTVAYTNIKKNGELIANNRVVVSLPLDGVTECLLVDDRIGMPEDKKWNAVMRAIGAGSLYIKGGKPLPRKRRMA